MKRLIAIVEQIWTTWVYVLFGLGAVLLALFATLFVFAIVYELGWSLWNMDLSNWMRIADIERATQIAPPPEILPDLFRSEQLADSISELRREIEARVAGKQASAADNEQLLERVTNLEDMLKIKPEEVASIAIQGQRLVSLETNLNQLEARLQSQISNMYSLILGLFGALFVTVMGGAIWSILSGRKQQQ